MQRSFLHRLGVHYGKPMKPHEAFDLTAYFPYLIGRVGTYLEQAVTQSLKAEGVSLMEWRVFGVLLSRESCSMGELSDAAAIPVTALSRLVGSMERKGTIVRRRSSSDARVVNASLTNRGRAMALKLVPLARARERYLTSMLTADQTRVLRKAIARLYDALHDDIKSLS
jgi:MarR family transcriptional regulator, organic hydroperoxide resistance regulator